MKNTSLLGLLLCIALSGGTAVAQEQGRLDVRTVVQKEQVTVDENGEQRTELVDAATVVPGDEVVYTVTFSNVSDEPAENVVITNPLPAELTYVTGSAFGPGAEIVFSVDGGKTFAPADKLAVTENGAERPARPEDFTHIRWIMQNEFGGGDQGLAQFRARLN